jgi:hypothetical protein
MAPPDRKDNTCEHMSTGAGRVERAVRAALTSRRSGAPYASIDAEDVAHQLGWGRRRGGSVELTRSQRSSILRALRRVLAGQPGWERHFIDGHRVSFVYQHPDGMGPIKAHKLAAAATMQRPLSQRQQARLRGQGSRSDRLP